MHRKQIITAIAVALTASPLAHADMQLSGFADITYMVTDTTSSSGGVGGTEGKFAANAEVDLKGSLGDKTTLRLDTDLALGLNGGANAPAATGDGRQGPADSAIIEQVYFAWKPATMFTLLGGVFNNPIGWEAGDAPDMYQTSSGQIATILDSETILHGNNIAGLAGAATFGPATVTVALLNDLKQTDDERSYAAVVNVAAMKGLDVELGFVTQDAGAGNVTDLNATFKTGGLTLGAEILTAQETVDSALGITANFMFNDTYGVTGRYDNVSYEASGTDDTSSLTLAASAKLDKGLQAVAELRRDDNGTDTEDKVQLEFIATF